MIQDIRIALPAFGWRRLDPTLALAGGLMFASGAAALVWQMVWTARLGVVLGHEIIAVLAVMAAFFGGLAAGALLFAHTLERSRHPARWYALLEAMIGLWALLVSMAPPAGLAVLSRWIGAEPSAGWHWSVAFAVPFIALLPATMAMGATLPAIARVPGDGPGRHLGMLYAVNTAGAIIGLLLAVFHFIPQVGLFRTSLLFAGVNLACAVIAWWVWGQQAGVRGSAASQATQAGLTTRAFPLTDDAVILGARLFGSGLLGIGYEVLAIRVLAQVTENTVYTYALLLADFLAGTTIGAALSARVMRTAKTPSRRNDRAILLLAGALLLGGSSLWWADRIVALPARWCGPGLATALAGELAAGALAMLLPAIAMGIWLTSLCKEASRIRMPLGLAFGINTLGCAVAPLSIGLLLLPQVGARAVLLMLLAGYLTMRTARSWKQPSGWGAVAAGVAVALLAGPLRFVDIPEGGALLSYREGVMAAVSVVEDAQGVARLHINNRVQEGSSAGGVVETRLAQLPLLLHAGPHTMLLMGYGTGYTANAAALDPAVSVTAVELLPEIIDVAGIFAKKSNAPLAVRPPATVAADARRFMQATQQGYDVIVSDLFHPARNGAGSLYSVEHFAATRAKLQPGGVFCQWLALHQMDTETLRSIVAAYLQVYPEAIAVLANNSLDTPVLGLIARPDAPRWNIDAVRRRLEQAPPAVMAALRRARVDDVHAVLGSVVAGPAALRAFADAAPVNTDDRPLVTHRAPWTSYASDEPPRARLAGLMHSVTPRLQEIVDDPRGTGAARLQAYWQARAQYIDTGLRLQPDPDPRVMLERLQAPLLRILHASPDFHPASDPLIALASAVRLRDPGLAEQVDAAVRQILVSQPLLDTPH